LLLQRAEHHVADVGVTGAERIEAGDAMHQRRLPRARRPHDRRHPAALEPDGDLVEGTHCVLALAVDLGGLDRAGGDVDAGTGGEAGEWCDDGHANLQRAEYASTPVRGAAGTIFRSAASLG
jgi:hypothetical protein